MSANFNVNSFINQLKQAQPAAKGEKASNDRKLEKVYLSYPDNYGKYQIFPMVSTVTGLPFVSLPKTREIKMKRKNISNDGSENIYEAWIKILPSDAYVMLDESTGRLVSSLTQEDEALLTEARSLFDQLYTELGGDSKEGNNDPNINKTIGFMRRRNYTIFHAKCLQKWGLKDPRNPERTNFAALFVCTAAGFFQAIDENISDGMISHGNDPEWVNEIYNRQLDNRSGYLIFSIALGVNGKVGYQITATHEADKAKYLTNYSITPEEEEIMRDPVADFLGWQAQYNDPVHLFNKNLMMETISYLRDQLSAVRLAKNSGADVKKAIELTTNSIVGATTGLPQSNDPMLAAAPVNQAIPNMETVQQVYSQNTDPFHSAPVAQIDPLSQTPVTPQAATPQYTAPAFAQPGVNPFAN